MKLPFMTDQCEQMLKICNEFVRLQVSHDEYLCMKVLLLLSTGNGARYSFRNHSSASQTSGNAILAATPQIWLSNTDRDVSRGRIFTIR